MNKQKDIISDSNIHEVVIDKRQPINISFKNTGEYSNQCVNLPITLDGTCIGVITNVAADFVYGVIWNYLDIERMYEDKIPCSVSFYVNKKQGRDFQ